MTLETLPIASAAPSPHPPLATGWPVLRLGFRPFYLAAALFAALAIPLWVAMLFGGVSVAPAIAPMLWHAHEMLFGFTVAVITGFLLTAGKAWTGLPTPRGAALGLLALLWIAARVAALAAPYPVFALLDLSLLPAVAAILVDRLVRAGNRRNLPLAGIVGALALTNLAFHLAVAGVVDLEPMRALHAGLALVVMIVCVMAGRVVPAFTVNATPGLWLVARPRLEKSCLGVTAVALASWVLALPAALTGTALGVAAALHVARQRLWRPGVTRRRPILWILHAAYVWIAIGLGLLAAAQAGWVSESAGIHALTVGAIGGLVIGMITRTARGHTGRPLTASGAEVVAYALVLGAALLRVGVPIFAPQHVVASLAGAALFWTAAFTIYLFVYTPWLLSTRLDGKDG